MAREYPPHVYGGAGVHLEYLVREMSRLARVEVFCSGDQELAGNPRVRGFPQADGIFGAHPEKSKPALQALENGLRFNALPHDADLVHCHTWYAHWGGIVAKLAYGLPLVVTVHSLEPHRPWKREQLGRGYEISSWVERTALREADGIIAVSTHDRHQILSLFDVEAHRVRVIHNGIDTSTYRKVEDRTALERHGIALDRPYVLFLGRISRQKGITHFLRAAWDFAPQLQVVLCAAAPDSPEIAAEVEGAVAALRSRRDGIIWIREMVPREEAIQLFSHAALFCCPSIYEPFGIINLEAMACEVPVVASAVGGIVEVVVNRETGILVDCDPLSAEQCEPRDAGGFSAALARAVNRLAADPQLRTEMGRRGRERAVRHFGWDRIAARTLDFYRELVSAAPPRETR
ncbi:MAG: glycogen synthase [Candidatus Eisenbacteria bacterium]